MRFTLIILIIILAVILIGCGKKEEQTTTNPTQTTTTTSPEKAPPTQDAQPSQATPQAEPAKTPESRDTIVTEADLLLPIYPGATLVPGSGLKLSYTIEGKTVVGAKGTFSTNDSYDKVVAFYKGKLPTSMIATETDEGGVKTSAWTGLEPPIQKSVIVKDNNTGSIEIEIAKVVMPNSK